MNNRNQMITALLLAVLLFNTPIDSARAARPAQTLPPLFDTAPNNAAPLAARPDVGEGRSRVATVNTNALEAARVGARLPLNLFDDVQIVANIQTIQAQDDAVLWTADVEGMEWGQVFLVQRQGQMALDVSMPEGFYQVRFVGGNLYRIAEVDQSRYPEEMHPVEISLPAGEMGGGGTSATPDLTPSDSDPLIDVLVAYTPRARDAAGGTDAIRNVISLAVAETNQSYINSGVSQRLNLVKVVETTFNQSPDMGSDLSSASNPYDGIMDELPVLRDQTGADLVSVIEESTQYCGIAYLMANTSSSFAYYAYSVVARSCATGYYSFAHELGHNMGARHDYYVDNQNTPTSYAHGFVSLTGHWRTIMAYDAQCNQNGFSCRRLPFWSNPAVLYGGAPMGAAGLGSACSTGNRAQYTCDADDHRLLNETTSSVVTNFRQHIVVSSPPPPAQKMYWLMMPIILRTGF